MKRRLSLLLLAMLIMAMLSACGSAGGAEDGEGSGEITEKIDWIISVGENEDYYMSQYMKQWMDKVSEKTDGMVTGQIFYGAQIGGGAEMFDILEMGNAHVYIDGEASPCSVNKAYDVFALPYLFDSKEHQYNFWGTYFEEATDWLAEESGIRIVGHVDGLNRETTMRYPVEDLAGFKNVKIRVPAVDYQIKTWEAFGTAPIPIGFYEVYTAIHTGVVDGQENDIALSRSAGFTEVAPYLIMTDHLHYEGAIFFDEAYYQSLPQELKDIMREASDEIYEDSKEYCKTLEADTLAELEAEGVTVIRPDLTEFKEAVKPLYDEATHCQYILDLIDKARI